jgi:hypothetical protein
MITLKVTESLTFQLKQAMTTGLIEQSASEAGNQAITRT